jgi:hypothetical protein
MGLEIDKMTLFSTRYASFAFDVVLLAFFLSIASLAPT